MNNYTSTKSKRLFLRVRMAITMVCLVTMIPVAALAQLIVKPTKAKNVASPVLNKIFKNYALFSIDTKEIKDYAVKNGTGFSEYEFEFEGYPSFPVSIYQNDILTTDYQSIVGGEAGNTTSPRPAPMTYAGRLTNEAGSPVYLTLTNNLIFGFFTKAGKQYYIEPLRYFERNADRSVYIVYDVADVVPNSGLSCGVTETLNRAIQAPEETPTESLATGTCRLVRVGIASDLSMLNKYQSVAAVEERNIGIMNIMVSVYANAQFGTQYLEFRIAGQYFSTNSNTEPLTPLYTGPDVSILLTNFKGWGQAQTSSFRNYAMNQLWTANDFGTPDGSGGYSYGVIGLAYTSATAVCGEFKYQILEDFSNSSAMLANVATHETGHNFNAQHDASGSSFIMAPSVSNPPFTTFSSASVTAITNTINTLVSQGSCLLTCTPIAPAALIVPSAKNVCLGSGVTFTDNSSGAPTSRSWSFSGGTPSTSTAVSPTVSYATTGLKTAYLTVTNAQGSATTSKSVIVLNAPVTACRTTTAGNSEYGVLFNFNLADINHLASNTLFGTRYTNNSCLENTKLLANTTYTVNAYIGFPNGTTFSKLEMYIDYNGDGDFFDQDEVIYNNGNCTNVLQFTFTTPAVVAVTDRFLRLRIAARPCSLPPLNGCTAYTNCNVEDYAVYFPSTPCYVGNTIEGVQNTCSLTNNIGTYSIAALNQTAIVWTVPAGATILSGQGTATIAVQFANNFISGDITVGLSGCGAQNTTRSLTVGQQSSGLTLTVGNISGDATLCGIPTPNFEVLYSIPNVIGANNYQWSVTNGFVFSGQGTRTVFVKFNDLYTPASVSVTVSGCGVQDVVRTITVNPKYKITSSASAGGSISPLAVTVNCHGGSRTFNFTANTCNEVSNVIVDGVSLGTITAYTFSNITATHTISVEFAPRAPCAVVITTNQGGTVSGASTIACGSFSAYNIVPDDCYQVSQVIVNGLPYTSSFGLAYRPTGHSINVTFTRRTYPVTVSSASNGSITPTSNLVSCGSNITYSIIPNTCYDIANVIVDGVSQGPVSSYTFQNVRAAHSISASYVQRSILLTVNAGANGSVNGSTGSIICGSDITYNFTPDACYAIGDVVVDGVSQGAVSSYTFSNVQTPHTISISFSPLDPLTAPVVTGLTNICPYTGNASQVTYTALSTTATNYTWTLPPNVNLVSNNNSSITVTFNAGFAAQANKQIRVVASNSCYTSPMTTYYLLAQFPTTPAPIVATGSSVCASLSTNTPISFTIPKVTAATQYIWSAQAGTTTITHPNGAGVNDTTISVTFLNGFTTSAITVTALNDCGASGTRSFTVTKTNPSTPGLISGLTNVCASILPNAVAGIYTIRPVAGATGYNWSVSSPGAIITHPEMDAADTIVSILFPANFTTGTVSVSSINGCGTSNTRYLSLTRLLPSTPGNMDVIQVQNCPEREYTYSIAAFPSNTTLLNWTIPAEGILLAGQGTRTIRVSYPARAISGIVTVQALSNCGSSVVRSNTVKLPACPPQNFTKGSGAVYAKPLASLKLQLYPNPTSNEFKLQVGGGTAEKANVKVTDLQGRVLRQLIAQPGQVLQFGNDFKPGAYILEVRQGKYVKMERIVKLN